MPTSIRPIIAAWTTLFLLSTSFVTLRIIGRLKGPMRRLFIDDWLLLTSWLFMTSYMIGWIVLIALFRPQYSNTSSSDVENFLKGLYIIPSIGYISVFTSKFSILSSFWYIFDGIKRLKPYLITMAVFLCVSSVSLLLWRLVGCVPISANWDVGNAKKCIKTTLLPSMDALYAIGIITDVGLIAFAVPLLRMTRLSRADTIGVVLTFGLVGVTIAASTIREVLTTRTGTLLTGTTWTFLEITLCVTVASMIGLRSTFSQIIRWITTRKQQHPTDAAAPPSSRQSYASTLMMSCKGENTVSCRSSTTTGSSILEELRKLQREEEREDAKTMRTLSIVVGKSVTVEETTEEALPAFPPPSRAGSVISGGGGPGTPSYAGW